MAGFGDVQLGQRFSFEVYPVAVLGNIFQNVRLEGVISAKMAASSGVDIQALHANVYPTLPPGTVPDDPFRYGYIHIQFPSGEYGYIGIPWIRPETVVVSAGGTVTFTFVDKTQVDIDRMLLALSSNGYKPDSTQVTPA